MKIEKFQEDGFVEIVGDKVKNLLLQSKKEKVTQKDLTNLDLAADSSGQGIRGKLF